MNLSYLESEDKNEERQSIRETNQANSTLSS